MSVLREAPKGITFAYLLLLLGVAYMMDIVAS